ncbi:peptidase S8/S53 domain-containing protein [Leptodontidium sp. 2 PMI_412]|nr:peptidase S8/S53 domain-containing protein [Leptodontidium sp. 2 PMI_412]
MIHLEDKKNENRVRMVNRLTKCNRELGIVMRKTAITQKEYTFGAKASRAERRLEESWMPSATKGKVKANVKTVTFSVPSSELSVSNIRAEDRWPVEGICNLVDEVAARTPCRMRLLLEDDKLWKDQVSLGKFLELSSRSLQLVKKRDKLILQVILANSLLHLYRGLWLLKNLDKTRICFYKPRSQEIPDLTRPYLACTTDPSEESVNEEDVRFRIHPYPGILALGILLLQIELGRPIEEERPEDSPNRYGVLHIDADRPVAMEMLDECRDDSSVDFVQAIEACLDDKTFTDAFGRDASFEDPVFRQQIFELIVKPPETALLKIFGISVEKLDQLLAVVPRVSRHRRKQTQSSSPHVSVQSKLPGLVEGLKSISLGTAAIKINQEHHVCLYDDGQYGTISAQVIRVAVLDTGLDLPEEAEWAYEYRIGGRRIWLSENERLGQVLRKEKGDYDGHGTHATALLLQVAPDTEIFVAQVFKDHKETSGKVMAKVIHQRIVDVFSPRGLAESGILTDIQAISIDEAIRLADSNNVIMLAAASNQGGNSNIAWPARLPQVLCIYATDSYSNRCDFTPTEATRGDNFAVLGQAVKSCWPPHLGQGGEVRKSGTSTATPIAAGIAAIVLDFVKSALSQWDRQISKEDVRTFRTLMSSAGMSSVFRKMKRTRAGYDYIVPWDLLDPRSTKIRLLL